MTASLSVDIEPDLAAVTARLKQYAEGGGKELKKQLAREMRGLGDRVVTAEKDAVMRLKIRGVKSGNRFRNKRGGRRGEGKGIRGPVADSIIKRNRLSGQTVGVEIRASRSRMPAGMANMPRNLNKGSWRHPLFGDRGSWYDQVASPPGFFVQARKEMEPVIRRELQALAQKYMQEAMKLG